MKAIFSKIFRSICFFTLIALSTQSIAQVNSGSNNVSDAPLVQQSTINSESNLDTSKPFGYNLFNQVGTRSDPNLSSTKVGAGDRIELKLWGAFNVNETLQVGADGNIFIPQVGPVSVEGVRASSLNSLIASKISSVYTNNVRVYARLISSIPVTIFIAGGVINPGPYAAQSQDNVISLISQAGGIDAERGSYRDIQVLRNNRPIANIDLYRFLKDGYLQTIEFQSNDVIHVNNKNISISASGATRYPYEFEFRNNQIQGNELLQFALPYPKTSHVAISGIRNKEPFYKYVNMQTFQSMSLFDQDKISFEADLHPNTLGVQIEGSYEGPSFFAVKKGARLHDVLAQIKVNQELSDLSSIYLKRKSTAIQQKKNLDESLYNLEKSIQTAPSKSDGESKIRSQEAALIEDFVEKAKRIQPEGRIIISENKKSQNILLEDADVIVIPNKTDVVLISGEVLAPSTMVYKADLDTEDYIARAGGFTQRAEKKKIAIFKRNGDVLIGDDTSLEAGDSIIVLPKIDTKFIQSTKDMTQILYQLALAAVVL